METQKQPQRLQPNPFEKKQKKICSESALVFFKKTSTIFFFTLPLNTISPLNFGCFLGGLGNSMSEGSTTGSHGEAWNLPGNHLAVWSRHREAEAGWGSW